VFNGQPLGIHDPGVEATLRSQAGHAYMRDGAAAARAYEARKLELAGEAARTAGAQPWYHIALQMFGLKPPPPDPAERINVRALQHLIASAPPASEPIAEKEAESPLVQTFAAGLMAHKAAGANSAEAAAAARDIHFTLALAREYQRGAAWGGVCFSAYNGTALLFAFALLGLVKVFSARSIHRVCLLCGGIGLLLTVAVRQQYPLIGAMVLVGIAWASILAMPYAMLANAIPAQKMGFYMGVFNFFIVIPQILASVGLGALMKHVLGGNPMNAVLLGGVSMLVAGLCVGFVSKDAERASDVSGTPSRSAEVQVTA
jgi:hypothetical protein